MFLDNIPLSVLRLVTIERCRYNYLAFPSSALGHVSLSAPSSMSSVRCLSLLVALLCSFACVVAIHASDNWIAQSWLFEWDPEGVDPTISIPHTAQCETINIHWERASGNVPDYAPPFYLRIYTSTYPAPIVIDAGTNLNFSFTVPFAPGTQYQICMTDSQGNSGGCQASYTVYPNNTLVTDPKTNKTTLVPPTCANVTFPSQSQLLNVTGVDVNGLLTTMAWADQCTDISLQPNNGTPPYVITIAPTYHPPLNFTSNSNGAINWTITLGWAHQFYLSVVDKNGATWATGPLHSGGNGKTDCLVLGGNNLGIVATLGDGNGSQVPVAALAGSMIGALLVGVLLGAVIFWWFSRPRRIPTSSELRKAGIEPYPLSTANSEFITSRPTTVVGDVTERPDTPNSRTLPSGAMSPQMATRQLSDGSSRQVYVVHHDGGRPPISVYHPEGAEVVELPPTYGPRSPVDGEQAPNARRQPQKMRMTSGGSTADSV